MSYYPRPYPSPSVTVFKSPSVEELQTAVRELKIERAKLREILYTSETSQTSELAKSLAATKENLGAVVILFRESEEEREKLEKQVAALKYAAERNYEVGRNDGLGEVISLTESWFARGDDRRIITNALVRRFRGMIHLDSLDGRERSDE